MRALDQPLVAAASMACLLQSLNDGLRIDWAKAQTLPVEPGALGTPEVELNVPRHPAEHLLRRPTRILAVGYAGHLVVVERGVCAQFTRVANIFVVPADLAIGRR